MYNVHVTYLHGMYRYMHELDIFGGRLWESQIYLCPQHVESLQRVEVTN